MPAALLVGPDIPTYTDSLRLATLRHVMKPRLLKPLFVLLLACAVSGMDAYASEGWRGRGRDDDRYYDRGGDRDDERGRGSDRNRGGELRVSLDQAVAMAERRFRARVVRAETRGTEHVLRLDDGVRVWTVRVDGTTGAMQ